ncbi:MAG: hypothetical protein CL607_00560 [Anaerolineaceae bacterium]|nr:hypothetical protein [Anaerolineaceae bacterium]
MRSRFCNPIYVGLGPFPALVVDETWVRAVARMIEKEGLEQFLMNMLHVLRESFAAVDTVDEHTTRIGDVFTRPVILPFVIIVCDIMCLQQSK